MVGIVYSPSESINFFATYSTAFETPTTESANPSAAGGFNPDIKPQLAASVELSLSSEPVERLKLSLAYTYSRFKFERFIDDGDNDFSGNVLPGIPEQLIRGEIAFRRSSSLYGALNFLSVGNLFVNNANSVTSESYEVVNFRAGLAGWKLGHWMLSPFVGVNNLSDQNYAANVRINAFGGRYFEPAPSRHLFGGVAIRYSFGQAQGAVTP